MCSVLAKVVLLVSLVILMISAASDDCVTPRNTSGKCILIRDCPIILNILQIHSLNSELKSNLQKYNCGYQGQYPKVCCETDAKACKTNDENAGVCVPISRCQSLLFLLEEKPFLSENKIQLLRKNECEFGNNARVCCTIFSNKSDNLKKKERLPQPGECGVQEVEDKLLGGTSTGITEFPWMALLEYGSYDKPILACGGSLISSLFILTAAHCVIGPDVARYGNLQRIRLGEYNIDNVTDCVHFLGVNDCADPIQRINVDKIISHEEFSFKNRHRYNDIALVKMVHSAIYSEFVRPICLPPPYFKMTDVFHVAGWGQTEKSKQSNIKQKLVLPMFSHEKCGNIYANTRFPINLDTGQICAGGVEGKDSCTGDSGGPLMASERNKVLGIIWYQIGIVSFGPIPCGQTLPGIYTFVLKYLPWIHRIVTNTVI